MRITYECAHENMYVLYNVRLLPQGTTLMCCIYDMYDKSVHITSADLVDKYRKKYYKKLFKTNKFGGIELTKFALRMLHPPHKRVLRRC